MTQIACRKPPSSGDVILRINPVTAPATEGLRGQLSQPHYAVMSRRDRLGYDEVTRGAPKAAETVPVEPDPVSTGEGNVALPRR